MGGITRFWFYFHNNIKGNLLAHSWPSAIEMYRNLLWTPLWADCKPKLHCARVCVVQRPAFHLWCWLSSSNFCSCDPETTERRKKTETDSCECTLHTAGRCGQLTQWQSCYRDTLLFGKLFFLVKCGILSEMFTGITERGAYTVMQSEWATVARSVRRASPVRLLVVSEEWAKFRTCYLTN